VTAWELSERELQQLLGVPRSSGGAPPRIEFALTIENTPDHP
jgi:hypothetical protein